MRALSESMPPKAVRPAPSQMKGASGFHRRATRSAGVLRIAEHDIGVGDYRRADRGFRRRRALHRIVALLGINPAETRSAERRDRAAQRDIVRTRHLLTRSRAERRSAEGVLLPGSRATIASLCQAAMPRDARHEHTEAAHGRDHRPGRARNSPEPLKCDRVSGTRRAISAKLPRTSQTESPMPIAASAGRRTLATPATAAASSASIARTDERAQRIAEARADSRAEAAHGQHEQKQSRDRNEGRAEVRRADRDARARQRIEHERIERADEDAWPPRRRAADC